MKFDEGARWTFVHSNGTRTAYVLDHCMSKPGGGLAPIYSLLNPATGKHAQVSTVWLNREPSQHSHWVYEGMTEVEEAA
jgi:hypothetical protein